MVNILLAKNLIELFVSLKKIMILVSKRLRKQTADENLSNYLRNYSETTPRPEANYNKM